MNAKTQNIAIAMLLITSIVLAGLLVGSLMNTQAAQASSPAGISQYLMCPVNYKKERSVVFVIDVLKSKMNTYTLDGTKTSIDPVPNPTAQNVDLRAAQFFGAAK
ncbi:MAG: hypothetical protein HZA50_18230 [Planctomycetes bacterium]|nr:hypothetical protein [Planctomycetota bacterium]